MPPQHHSLPSSVDKKDGGDRREQTVEPGLTPLMDRECDGGLIGGHVRFSVNLMLRVQYYGDDALRKHS